MDTILFDFGNVIGYFDHRIAVRKFIADCDLNVEQCYSLVYDTAAEDEFEAGRISGEDFVRRSCAAIGYRGIPEQFRAAFEAIFTPNPELCALIPKLAKRYRLILASNTNEIHSQHYRRTFRDVLRHFSALGLSHEAGARKPDRRFFEHCQAYTECRPHECLFIDDLAINVEAARAFGWRAIQYVSYRDLLQQLRSHKIDV